MHKTRARHRPGHRPRSLAMRSTVVLRHCCCPSLKQQLQCLPMLQRFRAQLPSSASTTSSSKTWSAYKRPATRRYKIQVYSLAQRAPRCQCCSTAATLPPARCCCIVTTRPPRCCRLFAPCSATPRAAARPCACRRCSTAVGQLSCNACGAKVFRRQYGRGRWRRWGCGTTGDILACLLAHQAGLCFLLSTIASAISCGSDHVSMVVFRVLATVHAACFKAENSSHIVCRSGRYWQIPPSLHPWQPRRCH